jgi:hypothetical protein
MPILDGRVVFLVRAVNPIGLALRADATETARETQTANSSGEIISTIQVRAAAGAMIIVTLHRPSSTEPEAQSSITQQDWLSSYVLGAAGTAPVERGDNLDRGIAYAPAPASLVERNADQMVLSVRVPQNKNGFSFEPWHIVTVACDRKHQLIGYSVANVVVTRGAPDLDPIIGRDCCILGPYQLGRMATERCKAAPALAGKAQ